MRVNFKKLYFYSLLIGSLFLLVLKVGFNLLDNESVITVNTMITSIAVLVGLVGSIIVRKTENGDQE